MGLINRFLLCLYTLSFAVLALGVAALVLQLVPERYIWNEFQFLEAQWQTGAVAFVVFLLSIHLLAVSLTGAGKKAAFDKEVILVHGGSGDVRVAVAAVQSLAFYCFPLLTGLLLHVMRQRDHDSYLLRRQRQLPSQRNNMRYILAWSVTKKSWTAWWRDCVLRVYSPNCAR